MQTRVLLVCLDKSMKSWLRPLCSNRHNLTRLQSLLIEKFKSLALQVIFEDCNHWLYLEDPQRFNQLIAEFVLRPRVPEASATQAPIQSLETFHA